LLALLVSLSADSPISILELAQAGGVLSKEALYCVTERDVSLVIALPHL